ncbi:MAG: hypothetical protein ACTHL1_10850 [Burkholderiaceae bacterium]
MQFPAPRGVDLPGAWQKETAAMRPFLLCALPGPAYLPLSLFGFCSVPLLLAGFTASPGISVAFGVPLAPDDSPFFIFLLCIALWCFFFILCVPVPLSLLIELSEAPELIMPVVLPLSRAICEALPPLASLPDFIAWSACAEELVPTSADPVALCARTTDDAEAISANDSALSVVFNVMCGS